MSLITSEENCRPNAVASKTACTRDDNGRPSGRNSGVVMCRCADATRPSMAEVRSRPKASVEGDSLSFDDVCRAYWWCKRDCSTPMGPSLHNKENYLSVPP